jgi:hypothetical protein
VDGDGRNDPQGDLHEPQHGVDSPAGILNGQGYYNQVVVPSKSSQSTVFFGGVYLLAKTTNALTTPSYTQMTNWLAQFNLPYLHADMHCGAYDKNGNLYIGSDGGIFMSTDEGRPGPTSSTSASSRTCSTRSARQKRHPMP